MSTDPELEEWEEFLRNRVEIEEFINSRVDVDELLEYGDDYALIKYSDPEEIVEFIKRDIDYLRSVSRLSISRKAIFLKDIVPPIGKPVPPPPEAYTRYNELISFVKKHNATLKRRVYSRVRETKAKGAVLQNERHSDDDDWAIGRGAAAGGVEGLKGTGYLTGSVLSALSVLIYFFSSIK